MNELLGRRRARRGVVKRKLRNRNRWLAFVVGTRNRNSSSDVRFGTADVDTGCGQGYPGRQT